MSFAFIDIPIGSRKKTLADLRSFANQQAAINSGLIAIYDKGDHFGANEEPKTVDQFKRLIYRAKQELN